MNQSEALLPHISAENQNRGFEEYGFQALHDDTIRVEWT